MSEGNEMVAQGRTDKAIECYVDAIAEAGETPGLLYNLGSAYCQAGVCLLCPENVGMGLCGSPSVNHA